jgi:hypothetical protein
MAGGSDGRRSTELAGMRRRSIEGLSPIHANRDPMAPPGSAAFGIEAVSAD